MEAPPPCVVYEDGHVLVVNKPCGLNTHAPAVFAVDGLYDWLRRREPRWSKLAILHRLDKDTSGLLVFGLSPEANRSLTQAFTERKVEKEYTLLTAGSTRSLETLTPAPLARGVVTVTRQSNGWVRVASSIARRGDCYACVAPETKGAADAVTLFRLFRAGGEYNVVAAQPQTGRTHQIRVHAAAMGFPILGDTLYGGENSWRVFLHASSLAFIHPGTAAKTEFRSDLADAPEHPVLWGVPRAMLHCNDTDIARLVHGERTYIDCMADTVLIQAERDVSQEEATRWLHTSPLGRTVQRVMVKRLRRDVRVAAPAEDMSPRHVAGESSEPACVVRENGVLYELRLTEGYSVGLFHDQRENRRAIRRNFMGPDFGPLFPAGHDAGAQRPEVLNCFAYTCAFSVCAALAGARATSLDLSRKYLSWGAANFALNGIDATQHDFIFGDAFDWMARLSRKGRLFDVVLLDPPTFSTSNKDARRFSAERDMGALVSAALGVLKPGGVLLCSTNAARLTPQALLKDIDTAVQAAGRSVTRQLFVTQPPDFAGHNSDPPYLKCVWCRVE